MKERNAGRRALSFSSDAESVENYYTKGFPMIYVFYNRYAVMNEVVFEIKLDILTRKKTHKHKCQILTARNLSVATTTNKAIGL